MSLNTLNSFWFVSIEFSDRASHPITRDVNRYRVYKNNEVETFTVRKKMPAKAAKKEEKHIYPIDHNRRVISRTVDHEGFTVTVRLPLFFSLFHTCKHTHTHRDTHPFLRSALTLTCLAYLHIIV